MAYYCESVQMTVLQGKKCVGRAPCLGLPHQMTQGAPPPCILLRGVGPAHTPPPQHSPGEAGQPKVSGSPPRTRHKDHTSPWARPTQQGASSHPNKVHLREPTGSAMVTSEAIESFLLGPGVRGRCLLHTNTGHGGGDDK